MKYLWIAYLTACASVVALADEVQLTSGRTLVGIAHEESDRWMVETRHGDLRVPKSEVRAVVPGTTPMHEYQERLKALDTGCPTADQMVEFALWAQDQGLIRYVNPLLNRAIEIDPDHRQARQLLGYVQHQGKWMGAAARDALLQEQARLERRRSMPPPQTVRRRPEPEPTPYHLGIPPSRPPRGSQNQGYGGFSIWGGVNPVSPSNLLGIP